jgi:hypothetical protein
LHADAHRYTVICEEPNWVVRGMEEPRLEMPVRPHGIRRKRNDSGIGKTLIAYVRRADEGTNVPEAT